MQKLSALILTFNEEKNIERCLLSLKSVADEIIVIDSFSNDRTKEICSSHNVNFIENKWPGINEQRNFALSLATNDYVLSIDADETLSDRLKKEILQIKQAGFEYDGYVFNRLTNYCGQWIRHSGWYPDKKLRLFDKNKATYAGTDPHDEVVLNGKTIIKVIPLDILHYSFNSLSQHIIKIDFFSEVGAQEATKSGKKSSIVQLVFSPLFTFIKKYFFQLGMLDGYFGFIIAVYSSYASFAKYSKLRILNASKKDINIKD